MSNIATLGLEFKADKATERIQKLCDKFDELSKKTDSIQEVFNSLSTLKPLNNTFVTQISAVGNALNSLNKINPEIATKITAITSAIATMPYMSLDRATKIAAFAQSLNGIKIDAATSQTFHDISGLMANLRPVPPTVSDSLHQFASAVNSIQPIKPEIVQSIQAVMSVSSSAGGTATGQQDLNALADTLKKFKGIKPEVAVSIKELFNTLESVKNIDANTTQSVANLGDATRKFQAIKPNITVSVEKLFSAMGYLPNIDADKANAIANLGDATRKFQAIKPNIAQSVEKLFQTIANIKNIPYNITDNVNKLGEGLRKFKAIKPEVAQSVKNLFDTLSALKPVSANLRISIQMLTDMFNAMAAAGRNASGATKTLGQSMGFAQTQTDGLSIAFRTLQGAVSLNFFKSATAQAVEFGTELAQLKSIASELNTSQIGKGVMNFSSVLGNPRENLEALYYAYSSGIRGTEDDFLKFTDIVKKTAVVNRASVIPMADAMTAAMNAYELSVDHAGEVADTFYSIVKYGKASGEQLANSFGQVSPTAKTLGVSLDELGAAIASLTKIQPTRVAITGLNNMLSKIMKPTKESRLALQRLGVDMSYSAVQSKGFVNVLKEVREALNGNMEEIKNIFPDIRGQRAAMQLLGAGWEDFNTQLDNFANKKGAMQGAFDIFAKDTAVQIGAIPETIKKIVTEAGTMLTKFLTLGGVLTPIIAGFNNMSEGARKFFARITLVVGAYTAYKAVMFALQSLQAIQLKNEAAIAAAQTAKLAKLREEVALRTQLIALSKSNGNLFQDGIGISKIAGSRVGFNKGFSAAFNNKKWMGDWAAFAKNFTSWGKGISPTTKRLLRLRVISGSLKTAWTGLGAVLGKVVATIGAIFSPLGLAIAGIGTAVAGIIDIGQAMIRSGSFTNYGDKLITTDAIEGIYNWWTGAADKAEKMDEYIQRTRTNLQAVRDAKDEYENFQRAIYDWYKSALSGKSESQKAKESSLVVYNLIAELKKNNTAWSKAIALKEKATQEEIALTREEENLRKNQIGTGKKVWQYVRLSAAAATRDAVMGADAAINLKKAYDNEEKLADATKKREEASKKVANASSDVSKYSKLTTKNLQELKSAFEQQRTLLTNQIENLKAMKSIFDAQGYKEASLDKQISISKNQFSGKLKEFENNIAQGNTDIAKKSLQEAQKNYNTIRDNAIKIGEDMAKLQFNGMLIGASDSKKYAIYSTESSKALNEVKSAIANGQYNAAAKSLQSYVNNTQKAIAIQNKLADAEKQANDKTLQMIQSLDKFKVTAMDFLDINSTEAMKLQSRSFGSLPQFAPLTTQQSSTQAANDKLATAIATYSQTIAQAAEREKNNAESQWQKTQNDNTARIAELQAQAANELTRTREYIEALFNELIKKGQEQDKAQEEEYRKKRLEIEEANKKKIEEIEKLIKQVKQSGIPITNLKGQKALG
jgi:TP901 family phage tail tape measure protein